ncbi:sulfatase [Olivibacter sp. CPCC 100613]|uniref:sulfatase family protein n=1 Tax=Olivibacter sp. CPCC 100613 TaxID=3079931 RepID=UPI002FF63EFB
MKLQTEKLGLLGKIGLLFLVGLLLSTTLRADDKQSRPNIIWITCEDLSPFIGAYGNKVVNTPNIDRLANEGVRYTHMYTTAGVCAPSRSSIITGMYPISIGTQHMRTRAVNGRYGNKDIPSYAAVIPPYVKCFPEYLRTLGYYTSNNEKQDYQFDAPVTVWDANGPAASYRNRKDGQPFFSVFNFFITHESQLFSRQDSLLVDPALVEVPPYYKDTPTARRDIARLLTNVQLMDEQVGELIAQLKKDGVYDNTYIFFYSDHGGSTPWTKREVLERGTHIPFIIRFPGAKYAGTVDNRLLSSIDFAPTVLALAGTEVPTYLQGKPFLGTRTNNEHQYVFAARDRMDELYDRVRAVRDKRFRYVRNFMPEQASYQNLKYRRSVPMMQELLKLHEDGLLNADQEAWFSIPKAKEELYDVVNDPHELVNLANSPAHAGKLVELRRVLDNWLNEVGDLSNTTEKEMVAKWWHGLGYPPQTAKPVLMKEGNGFKIRCNTPGASIGYRIVIQDESSIEKVVSSWDMKFVSGKVKNGDRIAVEPSWQVYQNEIIRLKKNEKLLVKAMRIGFEPSELMYTE